jgi:DNA-binding transcriptional regulator PaaX
MNKIQKSKLSYLVLDSLEKAVDGCLRFEDFTNKTWIYAKGYDRPLKKSSLSITLSRLKEKQMIKRELVDGELIIKLTDLGKDALFMNNDQNVWDGTWRIVVFDIPEQKRIVRNLFRRNLKKWGFKQMQKSVWISQKNVFNKLVSYVQELKIDEYVTIFESKKISQLPPF